nr:putative capsid [Marmot picobirnavirus]
MKNNRNKNVNSKSKQGSLDNSQQNKHKNKYYGKINNTGKGRSSPWKDDGINITSDSNDYRWYAISESVLRDVASYPFSAPVGAQLYPADEDVTNVSSLPGIMKIQFLPAVGNSQDTVSQLNFAANAFYAFMRQANSGSRNYEAPDLMMYFMGVGSVYEFIARGIRAYGCLRKFSNYNLYLAKQLVYSLGFDYDNLNANQTEFRDRLNTLIHKVNKSFHIPKGMPYFERAIMRNSNIYVDHPGSKFQMYVYDQLEYLVFDNKTFNTGTALRGVRIPTPFSVDTFFQFVDENFEDLFVDEDINIMSGDVLKAYGDNGCWTFSELPINYETPLLYDIGVLTQIHNYTTNFSQFAANEMPFDEGQIWFKYPSTILTDQPGFTSDALSKHSLIYQLNGRIISEPVVTGRSATTSPYVILENCVIDIPVESPSPAEVMESTRLAQMVGNESRTADIYIYDPISKGLTSSNTGTYRELYCGSECMVGMESIAFNPDNEVESLYAYPVQRIAPDSGSLICLAQMTVLGFDWHPILVVLNVEKNYPAVSTVIGDLSQVTKLSADNLNRLHQAAIYGLLDVPTLSVGRTK